MGKTKCCQHENTCLINTLRGLYGSFKWTFIVRYGLVKLLNLIRLLSTNKINVNTLVKEFLSFEHNKDHVKFAAMFALMNGTYKGALCLLRLILGDFTEHPDKICAPLAGLLAGIWIRLHDNKGQRNFIACLLVSRLVDTFLNKYMQNAYTSSKND